MILGMSYTHCILTIVFDLYSHSCWFGGVWASFRNHESLADYGDIEDARRLVMDDIRRCIELNPAFQGKLQFPNFNANLRRRLIMFGDLGRPPRNGLGGGCGPCGGCGYFPGIN